MKKSIVFTVLIFALASISFAEESLYGVDVRDLKKFNTEHAEFSSQLIKHLNENSCEFLGRCPSPVRWFDKGAQGPKGEIVGNQFVVAEDMSETRKNTIYSAEIENMVISSNEGEITYQIILFIHDETQYPESKNLFFRRLSIVTKNNSISTIRLRYDIPLNKTNFSFYVDIMARKTVLKDSNFGIIKVFPVAVGALDIRNFAGLEPFAASLTPQFVNNAQIYVSQPAGLHRARSDKGGMYKQRPFLGIVDDNGTTYKQVGWHYQMTDGDLEAGFITHGCLRTEDKNLFPMAEIVFAGFQAFIPVKVVTSFALDGELQNLDSINHPMPLANNFYDSVGYLDSDIFSDEYVSKIRSNINQLPQGSYLSDVEQYYWCRGHGQTIYNHSDSDQPGLREYAGWSTVLDEYCLTKIVRNQASVEPVVSFIFGRSSTLPPTRTLEPQYPVVVAGLCDGSLSEAQLIFSQSESRQLTFRSYISNCGCEKLRRMLEVSLIKNSAGQVLNSEQKAQMFGKYCE